MPEIADYFRVHYSTVSRAVQWLQAQPGHNWMKSP
jgi:hypothetical protein